VFSDTVVILAAGQGLRMGSTIPKVLLSVVGRPILQHVIDYWQDQGVEKFIFVVGYQAYLITEYLEKQSGLKDFKEVVQYQQRGIADAILKVQNQVYGKFIVQLGDCLNIGQFDCPDHLELGYGIWATPYQKYLNIGCSVSVNWRGYIMGMKEKKKVNYPGIGTYFLTPAIFPYIHNAIPSGLRDEVEITDVMNTMIKNGHKIKSVMFSGDFINLTTPADLEYAEKILRIGDK
jgi:NDP-sugar pyrophosphorylase family protein